MAGTITWTHTDETPALASTSLLPLVKHFLQAANIDLELLDISLSGRILQAFPDYLTPDQQKPDVLKELAALVKDPDAHIIKLPNASATDVQLRRAIKELQAQGYVLPNYPKDPQNDKERDIRARYDAVTGSVVNPVLRQGNAIRSIPPAVKAAARKKPHAVGAWSPTSQTRVASMKSGDFFDTEESKTVDLAIAGAAYIQFKDQNGVIEILKSGIEINENDIVDTAVLRRKELNTYLTEVMQEAKDNNLLLSLHLKATMMKKSEGEVFGDLFQKYFEPVFAAHGKLLEILDVDPKNGLDDLLAKIEDLADGDKQKVLHSIQDCYVCGPELAMVNIDEGSHHLSSPNNVIADVSMANLARWGGEVQATDGSYRDTLALFPDSAYGRMHQAGLDFLKQNGAPNVKKMGSVTTVRLQAEKAEEYGSKDTTFTAPGDGVIEFVSQAGDVISSQPVDKGDIWRLCRTTGAAIQNWADLALQQAKKTKKPTVFWLDENRPHDREVIRKLQDKVVSNKHIQIMAPEKAIVFTLERSYAGKNTNSVTGNLIGDHITDYFPILEIGSSSKMLSIIKLLNGGLVAETGSGGTAPDLLGVFSKDNHLLWDDLGTALALKEALHHLSQTTQNAKAAIMEEGLEKAARTYIDQDRSPSPHGLDTRQSHFYLSLYWAQELAKQSKDTDLQKEFAELARKLESSKDQVLQIIDDLRGQAVDLGGRYSPDQAVVKKEMQIIPYPF